MKQNWYKSMIVLLSIVGASFQGLSADSSCLSYMEGTRLSNLHRVNCPCHCSRYPFSAKWNTCLSCKHAHAMVPSW